MSVAVDQAAEGATDAATLLAMLAARLGHDRARGRLHARSRPDTRALPRVDARHRPEPLRRNLSHVRALVGRAWTLAVLCDLWRSGCRCSGVTCAVARRPTPPPGSRRCREY